MHAEALEYVRRFATSQKFGTVYEFGSRDINGSVRHLFVCDTYWGIDLYEGPAVDEVADAVTWRGPQKADCIVCSETLEHAPDAKGIVESAAANLKFGGWLVMTCATDPRQPHSAIDGGRLRSGEYYANVSPHDYRQWCIDSGFKLITIDVSLTRGDLYAIAQLR